MIIFFPSLLLFLIAQPALGLNTSLPSQLTNQLAVPSAPPPTAALQSTLSPVAPAGTSPLKPVGTLVPLSPLMSGLGATAVRHCAYLTV